MIAVQFDLTFEDWREKARSLLRADVPPHQVLWGSGLFQAELPAGTRDVRVPKAFLETAQQVSCHRDSRRWDLLYTVLYRLTHGEPYLLEVAVDRDVRDLFAMRKQVTHDMHQMKAFVRFRETSSGFVAWYQPDHLIVEALAPWFAKRFGSMQWSILTPDRCAYWDMQQLRFGPGLPRSTAPDADALEDLWRAYYASTFNPARVNPELLRQHMPQRRWQLLPEAELIRSLTRDAAPKQDAMLAKNLPSARPFIPANASLPVLREAVQSCRGCDLWECATQAVFGEGPPTASIAFIGEQPGDNEDRAGRPFVGPSGQLFDQAIAEAGLTRSEVYITGAVKHFRYEQRGKARIHKTASKAQISACQPWLEAELEIVRPRVIVCMGNTAALAVMGRGVRLLEDRGVILPHRVASGVILTVHPGFLLRMPDEARRAEEYSRWVQDIRTARTFAGCAAA